MDHGFRVDFDCGEVRHLTVASSPSCALNSGPLHTRVPETDLDRLSLPANRSAMGMA
jgi:hypothetical protein